jgi:O-antigen ligase
MRFTKISRDILVFLFALYYLQGSIYPIGSIISQICILLILLISGWYFVKTLLLENKNSLFFNAWTLLLLLNVLGFIFTADFSDSLRTSMFKNILGCMLTFYPFYYFATNDELKAAYLIRFFLIMLPITILQFYINENQAYMESYSDSPSVVNNIAYSFVGLLPFIFLFKKRKLIAGALMALIIIFIIQGAKRGAVIAGLIGLLMYFYYQMKTIERHNRIRGYFFATIFMFLLIAFAYRTYMNNEFLINRMTSITEGNYSERDILYKALLYKWYHCDNVLNTFFGFGFAASLDITGGTYAHNDWLELLSNFGLTGICVYLVLFYAAIKFSLNSELMKDKQIQMLTITMMWFFITLVSMWYTSLGYFTQTILLGYLIGSKDVSLE